MLKIVLFVTVVEGDNLQNVEGWFCCQSQFLSQSALKGLLGKWQKWPTSIVISVITVKVIEKIDQTLMEGYFGTIFSP